MQRIQKRSSEVADQKTIYKPLADALIDALESIETQQEHPLTEKIGKLTEAIENENGTAKGVLKELVENLTKAQNDVSKKLKALTDTVADKNDLIVNTQKNEAIETRKTLADMQSELADRAKQGFHTVKGSHENCFL